MVKLINMIYYADRVMKYVLWFHLVICYVPLLLQNVWHRKIKIRYFILKKLMKNKCYHLWILNLWVSVMVLSSEWKCVLIMQKLWVFKSIQELKLSQWINKHIKIFKSEHQYHGEIKNHDAADCLKGFRWI
jgi:hypothetical protein